MWSKTRRIAVLVGLALLLGALGGYVMKLGAGHQDFATPPFGLTLAPPQPPPEASALKPWMRVLIWLVLIGVWAFACIRLMRHRHRQD
jgi:hypothetical protein